MKLAYLLAIIVLFVETLVTAHDLEGHSLQHAFNDLLRDVGEFGEDFSMNVKEKPVRAAAPLVLLVGGSSTGEHLFNVLYFTLLIVQHLDI